ncbi:hypothetical protein [Zymobacter sp. IVIA_5232.4 C2]
MMNILVAWDSSAAGDVPVLTRNRAIGYPVRTSAAALDARLNDA